MKSCILSICLLLFVSCESDIQLKRTLELSGDNRLELNKVLTHYKNDSLKLKAAKFLIRNMQGNLAYDSTNLYKYRPILLKLDSLRQQGGIKNKIVLDSINKEWHQFTTLTLIRSFAATQQSNQNPHRQRQPLLCGGSGVKG